MTAPSGSVPEPAQRRYSCAECGLDLTVAHDMVTVNVAGHGRAAHRDCTQPGRLRPTPPVPAPTEPKENTNHAEYRSALQFAVRALALPYSDHLDYQQEWTP